MLAFGTTHAGHQLLQESVEATLGGGKALRIHAARVRRPVFRVKFYWSFRIECG
jgi:hypothetical protein